MILLSSQWRNKFSTYILRVRSSKVENVSNKGIVSHANDPNHASKVKKDASYFCFRRSTSHPQCCNCDNFGYLVVDYPNRRLVSPVKEVEEEEEELEPIYNESKD